MYLNIFNGIKNNLTGNGIYTDASKGEHGVGNAVIIKNSNICYKLSNQILIYTAEALAIITALNYINVNPLQKYNIYTDSLSTIQSIQKISNLMTFLE